MPDSDRRPSATRAPAAGDGAPPAAPGQVPALAATVSLFGLTTVAPLTLEEAARGIEARPTGAAFAYVVTPNAQHLALLQDPQGGLAEPYAGAWLRVNDSRVLAGLIRLLFGTRLPVVNGSDLTLRLLRGLRPEDPVTVIGGDADLALRLRQRFGLREVALHAPPMGFMAVAEAREHCLRFAAAHPARYVFVVTGAPRSEQLLHLLRQDGGVTGTGLAVGSALDFATGRLRRAPAAMQRLGLEWLFRLLSEPARLWRRYLVECPVIFSLALRHRFRG